MCHTFVSMCLFNAGIKSEIERWSKRAINGGVSYTIVAIKLWREPDRAFSLQIKRLVLQIDRDLTLFNWVTKHSWEDDTLRKTWTTHNGAARRAGLERCDDCHQSSTLWYTSDGPQPEILHRNCFLALPTVTLPKSRDKFNAVVLSKVAR